MEIPGKRFNHHRRSAVTNSWYFSDDVGSDSSIDDGLPKHLQMMATDKVDASVRTVIDNGHLDF